MPEVVVACAWYQRADYIHDTIDSLLAQDFDNFEIVVVNDGSPDPRVREILESYDDPRLRIIHQENTGFVGAISRAIEASEAPYIAIQGSGEISQPSRLHNQHEFLRTHPEHVLVASRAVNIMRYLDGSEREIGQTKAGKDLKLQDLLQSNPVVHGAMMFRRKAYAEIGGYRSVFKFAQDRDLQFRLATRGLATVLESLDVRRIIFKSDGAGADPEKIVVQTRLSCLARNCAREFQRNGVDLVEKYGSHAMLFLRPDKIVSRRTAASYLKLLMRNPQGVPDFLAHQAWSDHKNIMSLAVRAISMSSGLKRLAAWVLNKRLGDRY